MIRNHNMNIKYINAIILKIYKNNIENIVLIKFHLWNITNNNIIIIIILNRKDNIKNNDIDLI
jgi:hypothetical protein